MSVSVVRKNVDARKSCGRNCYELKCRVTPVHINETFMLICFQEICTIHRAQEIVILSTKSTSISLTENELVVKTCTIIQLTISYYSIGFIRSLTSHFKACYLLILSYKFYEKMTKNDGVINHFS